MKIKMLGTGSSVPSLRRMSPSCLISTGMGNILIDVGPSVVRRLLEFGFTASDVDVVILTHFHPDHTVDLATFLFDCNYGETKREKPLLLLGGKGVKLFYRRLRRVYPWIEPISYRLTIKSCPRGSTKMGALSIETAPVNHREESIGVRLEENGKSAVFSGDTAYSASLVDLASRADMFVVECSRPTEKTDGHLNLASLLEIVDQAHPRQVIITHLFPEWEQFSGCLPAPLLSGEDGMEIDL
jgi:ribonuclease BN (tRNA processing enzyme)